MKISYLDAPEFRDRDAASEFDRIGFARNASLKAFLRTCSPKELGPGQYEAACGAGERLFSLVVQVYPGHRISALLPSSRDANPADFCAALEKDPAIAEFIRNIQGGAYDKN
jgi:hypothetical protein